VALKKEGIFRQAVTVTREHCLSLLLYFMKEMLYNVNQ